MEKIYRLGLITDGDTLFVDKGSKEKCEDRIAEMRRLFDNELRFELKEITPEGEYTLYIVKRGSESSEDGFKCLTGTKEELNRKLGELEKFIDYEYRPLIK